MTYQEQLKQVRQERGRVFFQLWQEQGWSHAQIAKMQNPPLTRARVSQIIKAYLRDLEHPETPPSAI